MTNGAPVLARNFEAGQLLVLAPADVIDHAIATGTPLVMTAGPLNGDVVHIGIGHRSDPEGRTDLLYSHVAYTLTHEVHGPIKAAYISEHPDHVEQAPRLRQYRGGKVAASMANGDRAVASTPAGQARAVGARHGVSGEIWD
jgi:hypothetical protein